MACKTDCFAWSMGGCAVLTEIVCAHKKCPFYKTKEQVEAQKEKVNKRLENIGAVTTDDLPESVAQAIHAIGQKREHDKELQEAKKQEKAAYLRERREALAKEGRCQVCGKPNDRPNSYRCSACAEREKAFRKAKSYFLQN